MPSQIGRLKYFFIAAFLVLSGGVTAYEWLYAIPQKKCEAAGDWWAAKYRKCGHVMTMINSRHKPDVTPPSVTSATAPAGHP